MSNVTHKTGQSKTLNSDGTLQAPCERTCLENVEIHLGQGVTEVLAQPSVLVLQAQDFVPLPWGITTSHHIISKNLKQSHSQKKRCYFCQKKTNKNKLQPRRKNKHTSFSDCSFGLTSSSLQFIGTLSDDADIFWSILVNKRQVQRYVYMCLFWREYLYRDISEYFLHRSEELWLFPRKQKQKKQNSNMGPEFPCCRIKSEVWFKRKKLEKSIKLE